MPALIPAGNDHARRPAPGRVVLVDDDPAVRAALAFALEIDGFAVQTFADAEAALDTDMGGASCLVLDYRLPGQNGLDLLERLRAGGADTPAVLITSQPKIAVRQRAAALGARLVEKPLLNDDLVEAVRRMARPAA